MGCTDVWTCCSRSSRLANRKRPIERLTDFSMHRKAFDRSSPCSEQELNKDSNSSCDAGAQSEFEFAAPRSNPAVLLRLRSYLWHWFEIRLYIVKTILKVRNCCQNKKKRFELNSTHEIFLLGPEFRSTCHSNSAICGQLRLNSAISKSAICGKSSKISIMGAFFSISRWAEPYGSLRYRKCLSAKK